MLSRTTSLKGYKIKILITDDSPNWMENLSQIFADQEFEVISAEDGEETVDKYLKFIPDILIMDLNLSGLPGLEVINYIRNQANDSDLYILSLTSENDVEQKAQALNLGSNDFLFKPFAHEELKARINVAKRQLRLNRQLRQAFQRISKEIDTVASLQDKLLPKECMWRRNLNVQSIYLPSGRASGDYYDFFHLNQDVMRLVIADVSGHGARAAFLMAIVRALFRTTENYYLDLSRTMELINKQLYEIIGNEKDFVTIFAADIDTQKKQLTYINAGHCPGLLSNKQGQTILLNPTTTIVGFFDLNFEMQVLDIKDKCGLFLFTDGFYEWETANEEHFGLENFLNLVSNEMCKDDFNLEELEEKLVQGLEIKPAFADDRSALWVRWGIHDQGKVQEPGYPQGC